MGSNSPRRHAWGVSWSLDASRAAVEGWEAENVWNYHHMGGAHNGKVQGTAKDA